MVDTFSTLLRFRKPEVGAKEDLWAPPVSAGLNDGVADMMDEAIAASSTLVNLDAGDVTLTLANGLTDNHRPQHLSIGGANATPRTVFVPDPQTSKLYFIDNGRTTGTTFSTVSGVGVVIPSGTQRFVYVDAANDETEVIDFVGTDTSLTQTLSDTLLLDIENASAGDTQVTAAFQIQGKVVHVRIPTFSSTITPGGNWNRVRLLPNTPATLVGLVDATFPHNEPIYALVNGVSEAFNINAPRSTLDFFDVMPADSAVQANNDVLAMPHVIEMSYVQDNLNGSN